MTNTDKSQDEWGPWIGWNGGECPVDEGVAFQVSLSTGISGDTTVEGWDWDNDAKNPIVAYRIKKEPEVRVASGHVHMYGDSGMSVYSAASPNNPKHTTRDFEVTVQGDNISIRWADE